MYYEIVKSRPARFRFGFDKTKTFVLTGQNTIARQKKKFCFGFAQNQNKIQNRAGQVKRHTVSWKSLTNVYSSRGLFILTEVQLFLSVCVKTEVT